MGEIGRGNRRRKKMGGDGGERVLCEGGGRAGIFVKTVC